MDVSRLLGTLHKLFAERARRTWLGKTRAHIEFRELSAAELTAFARHVELGFKALSRVDWVEVNPHARRVIVAFEEDAYALEELTNIVAEAERSIGVNEAEFRDEVW